MRISIAQLNLTVGALESNFNKIREAWKNADEQGSDLLLTPELSLWGYPHYDQIFNPDGLKSVSSFLHQLTLESAKHKTLLVVGAPELLPESSLTDFNTSKRHPRILNTAFVLGQGQVLAKRSKTLLPSYDVFDEPRYFQAASDNPVFTLALPSGGAVKIGLAICEDFWSPSGPWSKWSGVDCVFAVAASPYTQNKQAERLAVHQSVAKTLRAPLIYVNQMGATDELLFDGASFVLSADGQTEFQAPSFQEGVFFPDLDLSRSKEVSLPVRTDPQTGLLQVLLEGLTLGISDYFKKTGFKKAILGLSGGIDSAVVACLAVRALGRENVIGVAMPSQYSSSHSLEDAEILARNLGINFRVQPIKFLYSTMSRELGLTVSVAQENLQSRLRGNILMAFSNEENALVLTTGNKSEIACGYCTLYGDMCGALAPIGDLYKTEVYELAKTINQVCGAWIPERSITKAPSAELKPNQKDQDSLPPYEVLDQILKLYFEKGQSVHELCQQYPEARDVFKKIFTSEFKRRQGAPILKISDKAFGIGRRVPVAVDHFSAFAKR